VIVAVALTAVAALTARRFPDWSPAERASLLWLTFYIVTPVFFFQYLVWGLPFLLLAGRLREAAAIQLFALVPTFLFYRVPWESDVVPPLYATTMLALWALYVFCAARMVRRPRRPALA
jgi:hypothetical protein